MLPSLKLYTQNNCSYCDAMKSKLDSWGYKYDVINISEQPDAKQFLKDRGHQVVPQLYDDGVHLNKVDTLRFTKEMLEHALSWGNDAYQGGVENFG